MSDATTDAISVLHADEVGPSGSDDQNLDAAQAEPMPSPEKVSHLPSWVLKMRDKINTSRIAHADTQSRITELGKSVDSLSAKLLVMRPLKVVSGTKSELGGQDAQQRANIPKVLRGTPIYTIPAEVLVIVLEYLQIKQVLRLEVLSRTFYRTLSNSTYWAKIFPLCCPHLLARFSVRYVNRDASCQEMKFCMQQYLKTVKTCTTFVQTMKDQRSVPKHRTVQPHRHTRQERQVTHPLPLFERSQSLSGTAECLIPTTTSPSRGSSGRHDMIMSHAETLSSDFRSVAHRALQGLLSLTSDVQDPVIYKLVADGVTTVLTALLMNEEGALQNYACGILANLLCWEARKIHEFNQRKGRLQQAPAGLRGSSPLVPTSPVVLRALSVLFGMDRRSLQQVGGVPDQVSACGGLKMLTALLTSPTASINLAGSTQVTTVNRGGGGGAGLAVQQGISLRSTTSSVQGMCNKQASRALVTLLYPAMPVPVTAGNTVGAALPTDSPLSMPLPPTAVGGASSHTVLPAAGQLPVIVPEQLRSPVISALFTSDTFARPWQFTYFYKSGAVKDQFTAYLRFLPSDGGARHAYTNSTGTGTVSEVDSNCKLVADYLRSSNESDPLKASRDSAGSERSNSKAASSCKPASAPSGCELLGRGIDGIGTFQLTGHAEADISGWSWYFHKSYVPVRADDTVDLPGGTGNTGGTGGTASMVDETHVAGGDVEGGDTAPDGGVAIAVTAQQWVQRIDLDIDQINSHSVGAGSARGAPVHVSHVGYWSSGVESAPDSESAVLPSKRRGQGDMDNGGVPLEHVNQAISTNNAAASSAQELDFIDESPSGIWGVGLWGVWETSSGATPHFELQKGGVFRAAPIIITASSSEHV